MKVKELIDHLQRHCRARKSVEDYEVVINARTNFPNIVEKPVASVLRVSNGIGCDDGKIVLSPDAIFIGVDEDNDRRVCDD